MNQAENEQTSDILIVDDTPANLSLLYQMLTRRGYQARTVSSGPLALVSVKLQKPDLILLDIMMPDMNGYEVCEQLKADDATRDIPVIFISALGATDDKVLAFRAGGVDYITKPLQPEEVLARVEMHLRLQALQNALTRRVQELEAALTQVQTLHKLLPICSSCKKVRDDDGYWYEVDVYMRNYSGAEFSHSICPDCMEKLYPEYAQDVLDSISEQQGE